MSIRSAFARLERLKLFSLAFGHGERERRLIPHTMGRLESAGDMRSYSTGCTVSIYCIKRRAAKVRQQSHLLHYFSKVFRPT
jgi:hypothetical protein